MLEKLVETVREAEKIFLSSDFSVEYKGSASNLVTTNDIAIQKFLFEKLKNIFGDIGFIGEEGNSESSPFEHKYTAIIDPIDGTCCYARGMPECGISVAVYKDKKPYIAVVDLPRLGKLYTATIGGGAYLNGEKISVSSRDFAHSCFYTSFAAYEKQFSGKCFNIAAELLPQIDDIRRTGSAAAEICFVAEGMGELFFEARLYPWDFAAGALILTEAGGHCTALTPDILTDTSPQPFLAANSNESLKRLQETVDKYF